MKLRMLAAALLFSLLSSIAVHAHSDDAEPTRFSPDHYLSYKIMAFYQPFKVFLQDQFIRGIFYLYRPVRLLNPSDKLHLLPDGSFNEYKRQNPRLHYVAHELNWLDPKPETKTVHIKNQFEESDITLVTFPDSLLAPAAKRQMPMKPPVLDPVLSPDAMMTALHEARDAADAILLPIPDGSHYLCYRIDGVDVETVLAVFRDQFWSVEHNRFTRSHLCNPAIKRHNGKVWETDIKDPENHLVCYDVEASEIFRKVLTRDQFGSRASYVYLNDQVCVPTSKTESVPVLTCGELNDEGICPESPNCPENTRCQPADTGDVLCICK